MVQLCDVVYVLLTQRVERWAIAAQIEAVVAASQGAKVDIPDPWDARQRFDEWLAGPLEPAAPVDTERAELEAALRLN